MYLKTAFKSTDPILSEANCDMQGGLQLVVVPKTVPRTWNECYTHSMVKAKALCSVMSESGMKQYSDRYAVLSEIFDAWAAGHEVKVSVVSGSGKYDTLGQLADIMGLKICEFLKCFYFQILTLQLWHMAQNHKTLKYVPYQVQSLT